MTDATGTSLPLLLTEVTATRVDRTSPSFVQVEFAAPELAEFGVDGPLYDQRIKLVFPNAVGELPSFEGADESWFGTWLDIPEEERGSMRTYTVRDVVGSGVDTRVVVDFVIHVGDALGPAARWAASASVGDRLVMLGPRRGVPYGGIEFAPPSDVAEVLLVGDETALPAITGILRDLPAHARGATFIEVPESGDMLGMPHPDGIRIEWAPRNGRERGGVLHAAVLGHLGADRVEIEFPAADEVDPDLWETPSFSSSGEDIAMAGPRPGRFDGLYAWIAGESTVVTALRRALIKDLGIDRSQVAFMGYWRRGVAMRS